MSFILGIYPQEEVQYKIRSTLAEVGKVFETQDIPITYVDRDSYHITLLYLGDKMSLLKRKMIIFRLNKYASKSFAVKIKNVRLGISRDRKDLAFMPVMEGADEMRNLVYDLSNLTKIKRDRKFIPHITLGRVRKDLTEEEFRNLTNSISHLNNSEKIREVRFGVDRFSLLQFESGKAKELKHFVI